MRKGRKKVWDLDCLKTPQSHTGSDPAASRHKSLS